MKTYKTSIVCAIKKHTGAKKVEWIPNLDGVLTAHFGFSQNKAQKIFWVFAQQKDVKEAVDCFLVSNKTGEKYVYEVKV